MSKKRRPNSRRPGTTAQTRPRTRAASPARTPAEDDLAEVHAGEQLPPPGALYPQILATPDRNRLRAVGGIVIGLTLFLLVTGLISQIVVLISWLIAGHGTGYPAYYAAANRFEKPSGMLAANLGLAALIPISLGLVGFAHRVRPHWLASVRPGLRWRYLVLALVVAVIALGGVQALTMILGPAVHFRPQPGFWAFLVVIVLTSPLQGGRRGVLLPRLPDAVAGQHGVQSLVQHRRLVGDLRLGPPVVEPGSVRRPSGLRGWPRRCWSATPAGWRPGSPPMWSTICSPSFLAGLTSTIATVRGLTSIGWTTAAVDVGGFVLFALLAWLVARVLKLQTRVAERVWRPAAGSGARSRPIGLGQTARLQ